MLKLSENKKKDLILKENNMEFMSYIKEQFSIHKIAMNKEHNFYFEQKFWHYFTFTKNFYLNFDRSYFFEEIIYILW